MGDEVKKLPRMCVCVIGGGRKQEERTGEELLMALLLSLSADCDSQDQLLSKTTSPRKRRKCSQEVMGAGERSGQSYVERKGGGGEVMEGGGRWIN